MEEKIKKDKQKGLYVIFVIVLTVIILVLGALISVLRTDVKSLNDEIIRIKEELKEYGVYIDKPATSQTDSYDTSAFNVIKPSDIEKESKAKTIVVWIGRQSCGYCTMYAPYITEAMNNYNIKAYYIDLANLIDFESPQAQIIDQEEFDILSNLPGEGKWDGFAYENVGGTPLTLIIKDGKVIGGLSGYADAETIMGVFQDAGMKKN